MSGIILTFIYWKLVICNSNALVRSMAKAFFHFIQISWTGMLWLSKNSPAAFLLDHPTCITFLPASFRQTLNWASLTIFLNIRETLVQENKALFAYSLRSLILQKFSLNSNTMTVTDIINTFTRSGNPHHLGFSHFQSAICENLFSVKFTLQITCES